MYIVYILISKTHFDKHYVGITKDIQKRLDDHNDPNYKSYTKRYAPWKLETFITFENLTLAQKFELYLKTPSGKAFLKKRFI